MKLKLVLFAALLCGCASTEVDPELDAIMSDGGLEQATEAKVDFAYVKPETNWTRFTSLEIRQLEIGEDARDAGDGKRGSFGESYVLRDEDVADLQSAFKTVFHKEMSEKGGYDIVDVANDNTLIVMPMIIDVSLTAPIEDTRRSNTARSGTYTESSGSLTVAMSFMDGQTSEIVARAIDKSYPSSYWHENTRTSNMQDARQVFRGWAREMRRALERTKTGDNQ